MITNIEDSSPESSSSIHKPVYRFARRSIIICTNETLSNICWSPEFEFENKEMILNMLSLNDIDYRKSYYKKQEIMTGCVIYKKTTFKHYTPGNDKVTELLTIIPNLIDEGIKKKQAKQKEEKNRIRIDKWEVLIKNMQNQLSKTIYTEINDNAEITEDEEDKVEMLGLFPMDPNYIHGNVNIFEVKENTLVSFKDACVSLLSHQPALVLEDIQICKNLNYENKIKSENMKNIPQHVPTLLLEGIQTSKCLNYKNKIEHKKIENITQQDARSIAPLLDESENISDLETLYDLPNCACCPHQENIINLNNEDSLDQSFIQDDQNMIEYVNCEVVSDNNGYDGIENISLSGSTSSDDISVEDQVQEQAVKIDNDSMRKYYSKYGPLFI